MVNGLLVVCWFTGYLVTDNKTNPLKIFLFFLQSNQLYIGHINSLIFYNFYSINILIKHNNYLSP